MTASTTPLADALAGTRPRTDKDWTTGKRTEREYIILFVARTGSSHLTDLLSSTGVGAPREWLNPAFLPGQAEAFGARTFAEYFARMKMQFTRGGVFGHEMTFGFYNTFSREVRLEDYFDFRVPAVFLFREDIVAQAVSLVLAINRQVYHKTAPMDGDLADVGYRPDEIRHYINTFRNEERGLEDLARRSGMSVRYVSYERHTAAAPEDVVVAIARHVGGKANLSKLKSRHQKLGDDLNRQYTERYMAENQAEYDALLHERRWLFEAMERDPLLP